MSDKDERPEDRKLDPTKIDWGYQIKYFLTMLIGIVAVLALLRYVGLRG